MRDVFGSLRKSMLVTFVGMAVAFPSIASAQTEAPRAKAKAKAKAAPGVAIPLDLNRATAEEMVEVLPGVGEVTAQKIIAGRPYRTADDLARAGVPAATVEKIRKLVTFSTTPPRTIAEPRKAGTTKAMTKTPLPTVNTVNPGKIHLNDASVEELETLPGVGPARAKEIIAARPFKSVNDLERVKGLGQQRIDAIRHLVTVSAPVVTPAPAPPVTSAPAPASVPSANTRPATRPMTKPATTSGAEAPRAKLAPGKLVSLNRATKEDLDLLPGIGPVKAQAILDYRATTPFKTKEDVMKVKGIKEGEFTKIKDLIVVD